MIRHIEDYHTANMDPWDFKGGDKTTHEIEKNSTNKLDLQGMQFMNQRLIFL